MEMVAALVYQLTQNMCVEDIKREGYDAYFVDQSGSILLLLRNKFAISLDGKYNLLYNINRAV